MWTFGLLGLFHFEITVLTALVPSLVIVIGFLIYFLTNKYQQEFISHGNKARAPTKSNYEGRNRNSNDLEQPLVSTFIITKWVVEEFGIISSLSIIALFFYASSLSHIL
jgi:hypothetical protein